MTKQDSPLLSFFSLKEISSHLQELGQIPLLGSAPAFDWTRFSSLTASRFGVPQLSIHPKLQEWRNPETLRQGLGNAVLTLPIDMAPLNGTAYWMMSRKDVAKLTSWMLNGKSKIKALSSEILQEGFYRYLILETMDAALNIDPLRSFTPILNEEAPLPEESAFCIDIQIEFDHSFCSGRLAIGETLRKSWVHHFHRQELYLASPQAHHLELSLSIETGSVLLTMGEWETVKIGDFIALDRGSFESDLSSLGMLTLGSKPLFHVKIQQNKIQLLDYARMHENRMQRQKKGDHAMDHLKGAEEEESLSLKEVPVEVVVELARVKMPLQQLTQLVPGNVFELPIQPEQPVALTVNGQKVGTGELVLLGETLGIRILDLG